MRQPALPTKIAPLEELKQFVKQALAWKEEMHAKTEFVLISLLIAVDAVAPDVLEKQFVITDNFAAT